MSSRSSDSHGARWAGSLAACVALLVAGHAQNAPPAAAIQTPIASPSSVGGDAFALKDGDTVVFYGDSITAQRLYTKDVEEFVLTRYPKLHVHFVNAGVPGDSVSGGYAGTLAERVQRDVAPLHPAMITLMLGMNDGGWGRGSAEIDAAFQKGYRAVIDALYKAAPDAVITLIAPTPYDEITHGTEFPGYSRVIDEFAADVLRIAAQMQASGDKKIVVADFNGPMNGALKRAKAEFPELAPLIVPDRIHPSDGGHWIMAAALVSAWHLNPVVSSVGLNAAGNAVIDKDRTTITNLQKSAQGLTWTQLDDALPLPFDFNNAMTPMLLKISNIAQLDEMRLRVGGLEPGRYELLIDGNSVASFSREDLQRGVNLALYKTPMLDQGRDVDWNEDRIAKLDLVRFMLSADLKETATSGVAEDRLRDSEDELDAAIRKGLPPKAHRFELRRQ